MKKKVISALLVSAMVVGMLTGCQKTPDNSQNTNTQDTQKEDSGKPEMFTINDQALNLIDDNYRTTYEVFVYSFYDSDGDGIGDLNGLTSQLDYINDGDDATGSDLGCTEIWLMPIMPSTTYHKYDVTDYYDIDPEYGTLKDFENFVTESHNRGVNVIIDFVMNHTSSKHEWFTTAVDYLKTLPAGEDPDATVCPYVDYYNFSREYKTGYTKISGTKDTWYYESQFWSEMPDLNLDNPAVRNEFADIVQFWLDEGVDGFRLDAVTSYYTGSNEKNIEVLTWFNDMVKEKKEDAYIVGEAWTDYSTYGTYLSSGCDSFFDFSFADTSGIIAQVVKGSKSASTYGSSQVETQEFFKKYSDSYIRAPFYTNHDMARSAGFYPGDEGEKTKIAEALNLLMSGNAFLYYGDELGMKGSGIDENKRLPMYWSTNSSSAGMCKGPAGASATEQKFGSYEEQKYDDYSVYNYVKQVIKLRNIYPEIARGEVEFLENVSNDNVCVIKKVYNSTELLIVFNISEEAQTVDLSDVTVNGKSAGEFEVAGMLQVSPESVKVDGSTLNMPAYSIELLK